MHVQILCIYSTWRTFYSLHIWWIKSTALRDFARWSIRIFYQLSIHVSYRSWSDASVFTVCHCSIYVDAVFNHMTTNGTGTGSDGSYFSGDTQIYPQYRSRDFNGPTECPTTDLEISVSFLSCTRSVENHGYTFTNQDVWSTCAVAILLQLYKTCHIFH